MPGPIYPPEAPAHPLRIVLTRLRPVILSAIAVLLTSSLGFIVIADYPAFDALYMAVTTIATVGYGEIRPLNTAGRIWAMITIVGGFSVFVLATTTLSTLYVSGEWNRAMRTRKEARLRQALDNHVIVVGFGRVGRAVTMGVASEGRPRVVIDRDTNVSDEIAAAGSVPLIADGTDERTLTAAGIERACALIAAAPEDSTNLLVVLTARALRPDLRIVARVNDPAWHNRICRAGADIALSPYASYGNALAASALDASVVGLQDIPTLGLRAEEFALLPGSPAVGASLADLTRDDPAVQIIGIRRASELASWQEVDGPLQVADIIVALGERDALRRFAETLEP